MSDEKYSIDTKAIRKKLGLSQKDFAKEIGVTQSAVSKWESGSQSPDLQSTMKMQSLEDKMLGGLIENRYVTPVILKVGHHVMLGSPLIDPVHWHPGEVLWTDGIEVLVQQYGIAMQHPHKALHDLEYVRVFGTREFCAAEKRRAEKVVRDAAHQCQEIENLAGDLRRRLTEVFETVSAAAIAKSSGTQMK